MKKIIVYDVLKSARDMEKKTVQLKAQTEMEKYAVKQLADSIKITGYYSVDRVVIVRAYPDSDYYIVVEGNRRLAAILKIMFECKAGLAIDESVLATIEEIDVMVIDSDNLYTNSSYSFIRSI